VPLEGDSAAHLVVVAWDDLLLLVHARVELEELTHGLCSCRSTLAACAWRRRAAPRSRVRHRWRCAAAPW
jgi:hypothetical protein